MPATDDETMTLYADLAETVLTVAREIRLREQDSEGVVALTPSNAQVMRYIDAHPGATASETAEATGLLRSNLSTALRELQELGFVEKRKDDADGRGVRLHPTEKAAESLETVRAQWSVDAARILGKPTNVRQAMKVLRTLADGLSDERRAAGQRWSRRQM